MRIEAVITCRNYADYLVETLPSVLRSVDSLIVLAAPDDSLTQRVCRHHGAKCRVTDAYDSQGGPFNKGAAINEGLEQLSREDWLLILDADIYLPHGTRKSLEAAKLHRQGWIYGVDRVNCEGWQTWRRLGGDSSYYPRMPRVDVGGAQPPPGYFQLFHASNFEFGPWYETHCPGAWRTDITFARQFDRRCYLGHSVIHLDSGGHSGGQNWNGRTSADFVPRDVLESLLSRSPCRKTH